MQPSLYPIGKSTSEWSTSVINNIKFKMPSMPVLYNWEQFAKVQFCNDCRNKNQTFCECIHLIEANMGDLVEMVVFNGGLVFEAHPFHIHGHYFAVIGIEKVNY